MGPILPGRCPGLSSHAPLGIASHPVPTTPAYPVRPFLFPTQESPLLRAEAVVLLPVIGESFPQNSQPDPVFHHFNLAFACACILGHVEGYKTE